MKLVLNVFGWLGVVLGIVPLGTKYFAHDIWLEMYSGATANLFWAALAVGVIMLALARILSEIEDLRESVQMLEDAFEEEE